MADPPKPESNEASFMMRARAPGPQGNSATHRAPAETADGVIAIFDARFSSIGSIVTVGLPGSATMIRSPDPSISRSTLSIFGLQLGSRHFDR